MRNTSITTAITRASDTSFYYAFALLRKKQREAIHALYAFCRIVDDIADEPGDIDIRRSELHRWKAEIAACYEGRPDDPVALRLKDAIREFNLPRPAVEEILTGVAMDLEKNRYESFEELRRYCHHVASAVGLCCIEIFGYRDADARRFAESLGIALQLTNIIRDVEVDLKKDRIYLPREDMDRFGVKESDLKDRRYGEAVIALMRFEAKRARKFYKEAWAILPPCDRHHLFAAVIMGRIYHCLLDEVQAHGFRKLDGSVRISKLRKLSIATHCWLTSRMGLLFNRTG